MRFTLETLGDVEVPDGSTVASCRAGLAALTGIDALGWAPLSVDGYPLDDGQVAGAEPWVPGAVVRIGAPPGRPTPDPARAALEAPWHLAVLAGPDEGLVAVPGSDGAVHVGRVGDGATATPTAAGFLALSDPAVSLHHAQIRPAGRRWVVLDRGSANGTRVRPAGRRLPGRGGDRAVRRRTGSRLGVEQEVVLGSTVLVVRRVAPAAPVGHDGPSHAPARAPRVPAMTWVLPGIVSIALALLLHSAVPLLFGLTAIGPALGGWPRRRRSAARPDTWTWPDLAASAVRGAACSGDLVDLADATAGADAHPARPVAPSWWVALEEGVAVTGPRETALCLARALTGAAIAEPDVRLTFLLSSRTQAEWSWCRWVQHRAAGTGPADAAGAGTRTLLVADGADRSTLDRWSLSRTAGAGVLLVASDPVDVPAWCGWTLDGTSRPRRRGATPGTGRSRAAESDPASGPRAPRAGPRWAEAQSRRVAARDRRRARSTALLPDRIGLVELGAPVDRASVTTRWSGQRGAMTSLRARIGVDANGPTDVDLLADGPHLLVAGTTGAGKSALLQSLVLDLALRYPPDRLVVVLVDFKGGAGLGPCRRLPHVVGEVTDLDPALAARALDGLRRELGRRERLFMQAGVPDLEELRALGPAPPRILVVVDELRALRDDLPDVLPSLIRLAAQGRSLGIHLVLATQRPAGAVDAQVRANVALRICLRVTDPAESLDVVDVPDAAHLPADRPGRAVVRRGHAAPVVEQTAWAPLGPARTITRWAPVWPAVGDRGTPADGGPGPGHVDHVPHLVEAAIGAALDADAPAPLWSPPLPASVVDADLDMLADGGAGLLLGLADRPERRSAIGARWQPAAGALLVVGRPGSGRTTTLQAVARSALDAGLTVHRMFGRPVRTQDLVGAWTRGRPAGGVFGTVVDVRDPRRIVRLLHLLRAGAEHGAPEHVLLVDDVGGVLRVLESGRTGPGAEVLGDLLRDAARLGIGLAVAGEPAEVMRLVPQTSTRLVLATGDSHDDDALGVPRARSGRSTAGRGVLLPDGLEVQVSAGPGRARPDDATDVPPGARARLRLEPIPLDVALAVAEPRAPRATGTISRAHGPRAGAAPRVLVGRGGDDAGLVTVSLGQGLLVVGPPRSGRTTALETIRSGLPGREVLVGLPRSEGEGPPGPGARTGADPAARLRQWWAATADRPEDPVVLVDDLDRALRAHPEVDEVLEEWVARREDGRRAPMVVAAVATDSAAATYRGVVAALRRAAPALVLAPSSAGTAEAVGRSVLADADPALPHHPGRGVLVRPEGTLPIQVARSAGGGGARA